MTTDDAKDFEQSLLEYLTKNTQNGKSMNMAQAKRFIAYHVAQGCVCCNNPRTGYSGLFIPDKKTATFQMGVAQDKDRHCWYRICETCIKLDDLESIVEAKIMREFGGIN